MPLFKQGLCHVRRGFRDHKRSVFPRHFDDVFYDRANRVHGINGLSTKFNLPK